MRIVLVAQESAGVQVLRRLIGSAHEVVALLTSVHHRWGGGQDLRRAAPGVPVLDAELVRDEGIGRELSERQVDVLLNVHSLFRIHESGLAAPRVGAFNLHPGPLPEFAGLNTVSWAVLEGAHEYGTTLHWMSPRIDAGPLAYETRFRVEATVTAGALMARTVRHGLTLIDRLIAQLAVNPAGVPRAEQDLAGRRYYSRGIPGDGWIDWNWTAERVTAFVRACDYGPFHSPWGKPRMRLTGRVLEVARADLTGIECAAPPGTVRVSGGKVEVAAADEWVRLVRLATDGRPLDGRELVDLAGDAPE